MPLTWIDPVILEKFIVQRGMARGELVRLLEEAFRGDGEKFSRIGGAVMVEHTLLAPHGIVLQVRVIARQHLGPTTVALATAQIRRTIGVAGLAIELMRKLVQYDVVARRI